jgi:DnaJ like chaperone protein
MQLRGKLIGSIIGAIAFQLLGAAIGLVLGHLLFDRKYLSSADRAYNSFKQREWLFVTHVFALCAKVAKAKGAVNAYEINFMDRMAKHHFKLPTDARKQAIDIWNQAKGSDRSFDEYALDFHRAFGNERHHVINMMDMLVGIAACDQTLHPKEESLLLRASGVFRISKLQYERIRERHIAPPKQEKWTPLDPHYAILGASPQDDLTTIKQKYRDLVKKWHPDTQAAHSASKESMRHANKKFQEIKEAYEVVSQRMS